MSTSDPASYACLIDGEWLAETPRGFLDIEDPATTAIIARVPACGPGEVDRAVAGAVRVLPAWRETTPAHRSELLLALSDAMLARLDDFARTESRNAGKPLHAARLEAEHAIDALRFFAGICRSPAGLAVGEYSPDLTMMIRREPIGVAALITPWNYPLNMVLWKLGPALAAGNTCVVKPSELTPLTALMTAQLADEILPKGVLSVVTGVGEMAGRRLVEHPDVSVVSLTGDVTTGRQVAGQAGPQLKRLHLELGGKAPMLILPDADPAAVASRLPGGAFWNAGQDCTAATRLLVAGERYDDLLSAVVDTTQGLRVGIPETETDLDMGPVISRNQQQRVLGFVERARGAQIIGHDNTPAGPGYFVPPTVIANAGQGDEVVQREIFGPVITLQPYHDLAEGLAMANGVPYGLAASIWTRDIGKALDLARKLDFGTVWINDHGTFISEMPHGGFKDSGYGKDLSVFALEEFSRIKNVMAKIG